MHYSFSLLQVERHAIVKAWRKTAVHVSCIQLDKVFKSHRMHEYLSEYYRYRGSYLQTVDSVRCWRAALLVFIRLNSDAHEWNINHVWTANQAAFEAAIRKATAPSCHPHSSDAGIFLLSHPHPAQKYQINISRARSSQRYESNQPKSSPCYPS